MEDDAVILDVSFAPPCASCRFVVIERERPVIGYNKWKWLPDAIFGEEEIVSIGCRRVKLGHIDLLTGEDHGEDVVADASFVRRDQSLCGITGKWHLH